MKHDIEFKIGDEITYRPYELNHRMYIIGIIPHVDVWGNPDYRVWYKIANSPEVKRHTSKCTGLCIFESKYYVEDTVYAPFKLPK